MRSFSNRPTRRKTARTGLGWGLLLSLSLLIESRAQKMERAEEPDEVGLVSIGKGYFPSPDGVNGSAVPSGNFEKEVRSSGELQLSRFKRIEGKAPEGKVYIESDADSPASLIVNQPVVESRTYLFSIWLKSNGKIGGMVTSDTGEVYYGKHTPLPLPDTQGEWKRVGFYFRTAPGSESVRILIRRPPGGPSIAVDDLRFREATEAEFSRAYAGWRAQYPPRELSPRPDDGKNLAVFVSKLVNREKLTEPILIMGIGSSYTNMLGNGERLIQWININFPNAPPIIYKKHVGSAVNFDYTRGWMSQYVLAEKPDLVILYSGGEAKDLEMLLKEFRSRSSADVMVASLHLRERDEVISDATVNAPEWDAIRDVALKYGCEWVDNRREWAAYLKAQKQPIEWLLKDAVHQNDHGALVINENICRHVVENADPGKDPEERERYLWFVNEADAPKNRFGERMLTEGEAKVGAGLLPDTDSLILINNGTSGATVDFRGNRIDLIGRLSADGGRMAGEGIEIDGVSLDRLPVFCTTLIVPGAKNHKPARGSAADRAPHLVQIGDMKKVIPQEWTIRMISDTGDYELIGSVTGPDGKGNNGTDFTGDSGQIIVPTALWRRRLEPDGAHSNRTGDTFTCQVNRATAPEVSFRGKPGEIFSVTLADQLENGRHQLGIGSGENGPCEILGFRVFEPPVNADFE